MRLIDADALLTARKKSKYYHLPNGDIAIPIIDVEHAPTAQPERDIPIKPNETTDTAWGIPLRQAVCPKCDYYLGHVSFIGDYKGKKVTYCETCGQAIDWEGWDFE